MRNQLTDLTNHLFEQLERLNDEELTIEQLEKETIRNKCMNETAFNIIRIADLTLEATKHQTEYSRVKMPKILGIESNDK